MGEEKEDLGIVLKTKNEKFWDDVKEQAVKETERLEQGIKFNKAVAKMAQEERSKEG